MAGVAPDLHVVGRAAAEDVADLLAGQHGGRRAPDVAGFEPVPLRRVEVDRDLDLRDVQQPLGLDVDGPLDARHGVLDLVRLRAQHLQVRSVDAHHDGVARPGQDLLDPLLEVGLHVALQPGIAVDDRPGSRATVSS